jgi:hypothetical protein
MNTNLQSDNFLIKGSYCSPSIDKPEIFHMKNIKKTGWDDYPHPSVNPFFTKYPA